MSVYGFLICQDCKRSLWLGTWLWADGKGFGFWRNGVTPADLGLGVLNFLAEHTNHEILVLSEKEYDRRGFDPRDYTDVTDTVRVNWYQSDEKPANPETS